MVLELQQIFVRRLIEGDNQVNVGDLIERFLVAVLDVESEHNFYSLVVMVAEA